MWWLTIHAVFTVTTVAIVLLVAAVDSLVKFLRRQNRTPSRPASCLASPYDTPLHFCGLEQTANYRRLGLWVASRRHHDGR